MDTENYLQIMIDSLVQKEELLKQIVDYNEKQQAIITLDEGFNSVFNRVKDEVQHNKAKFKQPLQRLKELVSAVTDLGVRIQAQELRNKQLVEKRFAQMRKELSNAKRATSKANAYYKNANKLNNYESHFLDQKK